MVSVFGDDDGCNLGIGLGIVEIVLCSPDNGDLFICELSLLGVRIRFESVKSDCLDTTLLFSDFVGVCGLKSICGISVLADDIVEGDPKDDRAKDFAISFSLLGDFK